MTEQLLSIKTQASLQHMDKNVFHNTIHAPKNIHLTQSFSYQSQFELVSKISEYIDFILRMKKSCVWKSRRKIDRNVLSSLNIFVLRVIRQHAFFL